MAVHVLENEALKVTIDDKGAELCSVIDKESTLERLHDADPQVWNRHSPLLFPFVGKVVDGKYRMGGKEYEMKSQHGFARDMDFICVAEEKDRIVHKLVSTEGTKKNYPFDFELLVIHELDQKNPRLLHVNWEVTNQGKDTMYYFIGGHPGFTTVEKDPKAKEEYYLEFVDCDSIEYFGVNETSGFAAPTQVKKVSLENGIMKFHKDAYITLIFDHQKFKKVRICRQDKTPYVTMECDGFPGFGIWAKENGNFICLEPWAGRTDDHGFTGTIGEKIGVNVLAEGEVDKKHYSMEFHR